LQKRRIAILCLTAIALLAASAALAQRFFSDGTGYDPPTHNIPYDGKFTFARIRYTVGPGGYYYRGLPAWAHGYPRAERNLTKILNEVSYLAAHRRAASLKLDDPELFKFPSPTSPRPATGR
jgi:hypothetical protein